MTGKILLLEFFCMVNFFHYFWRFGVVFEKGYFWEWGCLEVGVYSRN